VACFDVADQQLIKDRLCIGRNRRAPLRSMLGVLEALAAYRDILRRSLLEGVLKTLLRGHPLGRPICGGGRSGASCAIHYIVRCIDCPPFQDLPDALSTAPHSGSLAGSSSTMLVPRPPTPPILVRPTPGAPCRQGPVTRIREREWTRRAGRLVYRIRGVCSSDRPAPDGDGWPQGLVVAALRRVKPDLERHHTRPRLE
jgi:hypothetical protein